MKSSKLKTTNFQTTFFLLKIDHFLFKLASQIAFGRRAPPQKKARPKTRGETGVYTPSVKHVATYKQVPPIEQHTFRQPTQQRVRTSKTQQKWKFGSFLQPPQSKQTMTKMLPTQTALRRGVSTMRDGLAKSSAARSSSSLSHYLLRPSSFSSSACCVSG